MGFPLSSTLVPVYLSGENLELMDNFPELGLFAILYFCFTMTQPSSDALPEVKRWKLVDVALSWKVKKIQVRRLFSQSLVSGVRIMGTKKKRNRSQSTIFTGIFGVSRQEPPSLPTQKYNWKKGRD